MVAHYQTDGPYRGLYQYVVTLSFDLEKGLGNVTLDLGFDSCPDLACAQTYRFGNPAGQMTGPVANCPVSFIGQFNCEGNPSIDLTGPVVKWDADTAYGCEPGSIGSITLFFYSNLGPDPNNQVSLFLIKNGQQVCEGTLTGDVPVSPCSVPAQGVSWGEVKSIYQ